MKKNTKKIVTAAGIAAGTAAVASLSAYVTIKALIDTALDREMPKVMEKQISVSPERKAATSSQTGWRVPLKALPYSRMKRLKSLLMTEKSSSDIIFPAKSRKE